MRSKENALSDQDNAERERAARRALTDLGADELPRRPWRPSPMPLSAVDLVNFALWRVVDIPAEGLTSALRLLRAARAEIDGLEAGLLFAARAEGLTWAQIAAEMGFNSAQACQQHFNRLAARSGA